MSFDLDAILDELTDGQHSLQYSNAVPVQISSLMAEAVNDVGDITYADVFKQDDLQPTVPTMQLSDTIAQANIAYIRGNVDEAISILHKIIKAKPDNAQVWSTLGMMHEERGDLKKSLQCLMMAAHLKPKDFEQWSRLGILSKKLDYDDHALYCFSKAVSANPFDTDAIWEQAVIFQEKGMVEAAILQFESILELKPFNMRVVKELAKLYYSQGLVGQAIDLFEKAIEFQGNSVPSESVSNLGNDSDEEIVGQVNPDRTKYEEINMLAELYLEANEFEKAIVCIKNGIFRLLRRSYDMTRDLEDRETHIIQIPLPIRVKLGIARLFNNEMDIAKSHFQYLYQDDPLQFCELFFDVGEAYSKMGYYSVAQDVFNILTNYSETNVPLLWTQIASCCYHQGNLEEAISFYIAKADYGDQETRRKIIEIYEEMGDNRKAEKFWTEYKEVDKRPKDSILTRNLFEVAEDFEPFIFKAPQIGLKAKAAAKRLEINQQLAEKKKDETLSIYDRMQEYLQFLFDPIKRV